MSVNGFLYPTSLPARNKPLARTSRLKRVALPHSTTPIPKVRRKPRVRKTVIRLTCKALKALRREVWLRDGERCGDCEKALPLEGGLMERMHLSHIQSRGAGGGDTLENTRCLCWHCHLVVLHMYGADGMKPCPSKVVA